MGGSGLRRALRRIGALSVVSTATLYLSALTMDCPGRMNSNWLQGMAGVVVWAAAAGFLRSFGLPRILMLNWKQLQLQKTMIKCTLNSKPHLRKLTRTYKQATADVSSSMQQVGEVRHL